nr:DUF4315 family protein [uncultured Acetatifactor sp.]
MNPKIKKLRAERAKNDSKIKALSARNDEIDQEVTKLENLDIIGLVRGIGLTPDQLAALIQANTPAAANYPQVREEADGHADR